MQASYLSPIRNLFSDLALVLPWCSFLWPLSPHRPFFPLSFTVFLPQSTMPHSFWLPGLFPCYYFCLEFVLLSSCPLHLPNHMLSFQISNTILSFPSPQNGWKPLSMCSFSHMLLPWAHCTLHKGQKLGLYHVYSYVTEI